MKAVRFYGAGDIRFEEIDDAGSDDEVLVRVLYAGICGSDLHIYRKGMFVKHIPETMGHEFVGIIEKTGRQAEGFSAGDIVTANPMVPCMKCSGCRNGHYNSCKNLGFIGEVRPGCFAEYITMRAERLVKICVSSKSEADIRKYVLCEPLAVAVNVCRRAGLKAEDRLAVFGAGPIGCLIAALAKQVYHVSEVTAADISEKRLAYAQRAGADHTGKTSEIKGSFDVTVDCAGVKETVDAALGIIEENGRLCVVSIFEKNCGIDCSKIVERQLQIIGCNAYEDQDIEAASRILADKDFQAEFLISHVFRPEDCKKAFITLSDLGEGAEKAIFKMSGQ